VRRMKVRAEELDNLEPFLLHLLLQLLVFQSVPDFLGHRPALPGDGDPPPRRRAPVRASLGRPHFDSDGAIDHFIDREDVEAPCSRSTLPSGEHSNYIGLFLNGAYQESWANSTNLFGTQRRPRSSRRGRGGLPHRSRRERATRWPRCSTTCSTHPRLMGRARSAASRARPCAKQQIPLPQMRLL